MRLVVTWEQKFKPKKEKFRKSFEGLKNKKQKLKLTSNTMPTKGIRALEVSVTLLTTWF